VALTVKEADGPIFRDLVGKFVQVYLDDIVVYKTSVSEHERHLESVSQRSRKSTLFLNKISTK